MTADEGHLAPLEELLPSSSSGDGGGSAAPARAAAAHRRPMYFALGALVSAGLVLALDLEGCSGGELLAAGACEPPEDFCNTSLHREDVLSYRDCDGDGILDPYCEGGDLLRFGFLSSRDGCRSNWPHGLCVHENQPGRSQGSFAGRAATNEITLIHFNDVYELEGRIMGETRRGGFSRAAYYLNQERRRNPDRTFAVFAGDALSPSGLSNLFGGAQMVDVLNAMELDAASLGNHEFDNGVDSFVERANESRFPWLNTNLMDEEGRLLAGTRRHLVREVPFAPQWAPEQQKTAKVCFFGVAYDVRQSIFRDTERITFRDVIEASRAEVEHLRASEGCDVVMPLTHQFSGDDCALSEALGADVDLILGGHDHSTEFTSSCGHAPYVKAASDLVTQWVMTLWLDENGRVQTVDGRMISLTEADPFDEAIHRKVVEWEMRGEREMGNRIGCLKGELDVLNTHSRRELTTSGIFVTDSLRAFHKTDVAVMNGGGIRGNRVIEAGDITRQTLIEIHPFGNLIMRIYATGAQLREYINSKLDCWEDICGDFVQVSGLRYTFDPERPAGRRLVSLHLADGRPVDPLRNYTLAITDFMLSGSRMQGNRLYNMVTANDAAPLLLALMSAVREAGEGCANATLDGRIRRV